VDEGNPVGRVDVQFDGADRAVVTWLERVGNDGAEVRVRTVAPDGDSAPFVVVASSSAARTSGFPRMIRSGDEIVFAWTQPGDTARVRLAVAHLNGEPR
jgi:hypothetical protein